MFSRCLPMTRIGEGSSEVSMANQDPFGMSDLPQQSIFGISPTSEGVRGVLRRILGEPERRRGIRLQGMQEQEMRRDAALGPLKQKLLEAQVGEVQAQAAERAARAKALGQPGVIPVVDPITGETKFVVPKGAKFAPKAPTQSAADRGKEEAKKTSLRLIDQARGMLRQAPSGLIGGIPARIGA